jgi:hypothetical protein
MGQHDPVTRYGVCGIITAILCFPIGLICLLYVAFKMVLSLARNRLIILPVPTANKDARDVKYCYDLGDIYESQHIRHCLITISEYVWPRKLNIYMLGHFLLLPNEISSWQHSPYPWTDAVACFRLTGCFHLSWKPETAQ